MRDVLFRGKNKLTGAWVYGDLRNYEKSGAKAIFSHELLFRVEVDPSTIGQYTELIDKNGERIWDGDIADVRIIGGEYQGFSWGRQKVVFERGAFCVEDYRGDTTPLRSYAPGVEIEVVGNIYDNPELLEGKVDV